MGITVCENERENLHVSVSYDIQTENQGVVFVSYSAVCLAFEAVFLFFTLRFFCADHRLRSNTYAVIFYVTFHLSLLTTALYFLGGVVCYGIVVYNFLSTASYLLQGTGVFAVTMNMLDSLWSLPRDDSSAAIYHTWWFIPPFAAYAVFFIVLFFVEVKNNKLYNFYLYNLLCSLVLASTFYVVAKSLSTELLVKYPSILTPVKHKMWRVVAFTITILMIAKAVCALFDYMGVSLYLKDNNLLMFTSYVIVLSLLFDLLPCVVLMLFISVQIYSVERSKSIGEIMGNLEEKTTCFSRPENGNGNVSLMEEMVEGENAKDDFP